MNNIDMTRLKSPVLWISLLAQVVSMLILLGVIDTGMGEAINGVVAAVCELLTVFGVLNNPTDRSNF